MKNKAKLLLLLIAVMIFTSRCGNQSVKTGKTTADILNDLKSQMKTVVLRDSPLHLVDSNYSIQVGFIQDDLVVPIDNNKITLSKKPFVIKVENAKTTKICVNFSLKNDNYESAQAGEPLFWVTVHGFGFADNDFNPYKNLTIDGTDDSGMNYWMYIDEDNHRFDRYELNEEFTGYRIIENLSIAHGDEYPVREFPYPVLYAVFFDYYQTNMTEFDHSGLTNYSVEIYRLPLQIHFAN